MFCDVTKIFLGILFRLRLIGSLCVLMSVSLYYQSLWRTNVCKRAFCHGLVFAERSGLMYGFTVGLANAQSEA